jgi:uncharacterized protein (TIGR02145 family)
MKTIIRLSLISLGFITVCFSCIQCKEIPKVKTEEVTTPSDNSANITGTITDDGNATITKQGFYYGTLPKSETSGVEVQNVTEGTTSFSATIIGLDPNTKYYIKAYAINSQGTGYGNEVSFSTTNVTDIDGNVYNSVKIGTQTWMKENLKVTKYRDGSSVQNITDNTAWLGLTTGAYCWYGNDITSNKSVYGALYNWYAVQDNRKICPSGWHVPNDIDWNALESYLGGSGTAGGKIKEIGTTHWKSPNTGATNESGFTALPGGFRNLSVSFGNIGSDGDWWSSTETDATHAWSMGLLYNYAATFYGSNLKTDGRSVRCIKD